METKATEDEVDNRSKETNLEEKVKKAQNVREKLAEMKNVYVEDMEDDDADDDDKRDFDDEDDDVVIEKSTLSEHAKEGNVEEQTPTETCQVKAIFITSLFVC